MHHDDDAADGGGEDDDFVIDDLDAIAAAAAELDGNRPRRPNPLTIIQVKNPAKNVDGGGGGGGPGGPFGAGLRWTRPRQLCVTAVSGLALCMCVAGVLNWKLGSSASATGGGGTTYCPSPGSCFEDTGAAYFLLGNNNNNNNQKWTKNFDDISKSIQRSSQLLPLSLSP